MPLWNIHSKRHTHTHTHIHVNGRGEWRKICHQFSCEPWVVKERKKRSIFLFSTFSLSLLSPQMHTLIANKGPFFVRCINQKSMLIFLSSIERSSLPSMKEIVFGLHANDTVDSIEIMMASFCCTLSCATKRKHKCAFTPTRQKIKATTDNRQHSITHSKRFNSYHSSHLKLWLRNT